MILEDDMAFLQWPSQRLMYSAPPGWEVLQLYSLSPTLQPLLDQPPALWLAWSREFWSASAYIINRAGMHKVQPPTTIAAVACRKAKLSLLHDM